MMKKYHALTFMLILLTTSYLVLLTSPTSEGEITVDDDGGADYTTIQDAVNASIQGDTIQVFPGTYNENVTIINRTNIRLIGEDKETTTINGKVYIGSDFVEIEGFTIQSGEYGVYISSSNFSKINNNIFLEIGELGAVHLSNSHNNTISNNTINQVEIEGVYIKGNDNIVEHNFIYKTKGGIVIEGNRTEVSNNEIFNNSLGIYLYKSNENTIIDNIVYDSSSEGIRLWDSDRNTVEHNSVNDTKGIVISSYSDYNTIIDNIIWRNEKGIYLTNHSEYNNIYNNKITQVEMEGIYITSNDNIIEHNFIYETKMGIVIEGNGTEASNNEILNNSLGIYLYKSNENTIIDNMVYDSSSEGIKLWYSDGNEVEHNSVNDTLGVVISSYSDYNRIADNIIWGNEQGIYLTNRSGYNEVHNNTIFDCLDRGILIYSKCENNTITENRVSRSKYGIDFYNSSYNHACGNTVYNNTKDGIRAILEAAENTIEDNHIFNNSEKGIALQPEYSHNMVKGNLIEGNDVGIFVRSSFNYLQGCRLIGNNNGTVFWYGTANNTLSETRITDSVENGVCIYSNETSNTYLEIENSTITGSGNADIWYTKEARILIINSTFLDQIAVELSGEVRIMNYLTVVVLKEDGSPLPNANIEIYQFEENEQNVYNFQTNSAGLRRYILLGDRVYEDGVLTLNYSSRLNISYMNYNFRNNSRLVKMSSSHAELFEADNTPPTLLSMSCKGETSDEEGIFDRALDGNLTIELTINERVIYEVLIDIDGISGYSSERDIKMTNSTFGISFSLIWNGRDAQGMLVTDGTYSIQMLVEDEAGNTISSPYPSIDFVIRNTDLDNDGYPDISDAFPHDPDEWVDSDSDGVGDNGDAFPDDPNEWADSDGDGVGDNSDEFPKDPDEWKDSDGDGVGDNGDFLPYVHNTVFFILLGCIIAAIVIAVLFVISVHLGKKEGKGFEEEELALEEDVALSKGEDESLYLEDDSGLGKKRKK